MVVLSEAVTEAVELPGVVAGAIVEIENGICLARSGNEELFSLSLIGMVNAQMIRSELRMVEEQFPQENIEDMMITLGKHCHLLRLIPSFDNAPRLFLYVVMARNTGNAAIARHRMTEITNRVAQSPEASQWKDISQLTSLTPYPGAASALGFDESSDSDTDEEELPPFMREETVMKLLAAAEAAQRNAMQA